MTGNPATLIPVALFLILGLCLTFLIRYRSRKRRESGFVSEYFIGSRSLGGFVLAMTTIATYGSVSSFVGGPGQAWNVGFGWVYMATVQVTALFLLYGIMGKKMALISRKIGAITVIDVIRARYNSNALATVSAIVIVLFFAATMVAQFVGGAKLFEAVTGYSYEVGLAIFGIAAILFTALGGFRGVAFVDTLCGIAMIVGIFVLAGGILNAGGGYENIMANLQTHSPQLLDPFGGGDMPLGLYFTQWLLVGVFTFCLPQSVVRCMGYKDSRSLRQALVIGTIIIGAMMIGVTALGVLAKGILPADLSAYGNSVDNIIPLAIVQSLPPWLAGVAIIGPVAASISTVASLLIFSSSSIIKDIYLHHCEERKNVPSEGRVARFSQIFTFVVGVIVFILSVVPPDVIWKINMFAFGGLETAFCWVLVMGLFWKRANKTGAILSMVVGTVVYCGTMAAGITFFGLHQIVFGIIVSFICMVVGSLLSGSKNDARELETRAIFFGE